MALLQILKAKTHSKFRFSCFLKSLGKVIIVVIKRTQWKERDTGLKHDVMLCILNILFLYYFKMHCLEGTSMWKKTLIEIKTWTLISVCFGNISKLKREKHRRLNAQVQHTTCMCRLTLPIIFNAFPAQHILTWSCTLRWDATLELKVEKWYSDVSAIRAVKLTEVPI